MGWKNLKIWKVGHIFLFQMLPCSIVKKQHSIVKKQQHNIQIQFPIMTAVFLDLPRMLFIKYSQD